MIPDGADGKKKRKRCWFIRLGANDLSNVRFAGYPVTAPRINGIESSRSTFQDTLWKLGTKYKKVEAQLEYTMFQKFLDAAAIQTRRLSHVMIKEEEMNCLNHDPGLVVSDGSTFYPAVEKGGSFSSPPPLMPPPVIISHQQHLLLLSLLLLQKHQMHRRHLVRRDCC